MKLELELYETSSDNIYPYIQYIQYIQYVQYIYMPLQSIRH